MSDCSYATSSQAHTAPPRYTDIIAFDKTRILLPPAERQAAGEYVNASLVQEPNLGLPEDQYPRRWWVASQVRLHALRRRL